MAKLPYKDLKHIVAVDFDGVLHENPEGEDYGEPMPGARDSVHAMMDAGFEPYVFTARTDFKGVKNWLDEHDFPAMEVSNVKKPAGVYIDDRAIRHSDWKDTMRTFKDVAESKRAKNLPTEASA